MGFFAIPIVKPDYSFVMFDYVSRWTFIPDSTVNNNQYKNKNKFKLIDGQAMGVTV